MLNQKNYLFLSLSLLLSNFAFGQRVGIQQATPISRLDVNGNVTVGATYSGVNAAPTDGLRVEGQSVIGSTTQDSRDKFSVMTAPAAYQNVTGYPGVLSSRAIAGYSQGTEMGVFGVSDIGGYGVVGLTKTTLSSFIQGGEGVLGQGDASSSASTNTIIGVHGILHETVSTGAAKSAGVLGENNNGHLGAGIGGSYGSGAGASLQGVYGNIGWTTTQAAGTNEYAFGVVGDVLAAGGNLRDAVGGVVGLSNVTGIFGILGYVSTAGTNYSVYGGGASSSVAVGNTGRFGNPSETQESKVSNNVGLGINGGAMGGYVRGDYFGMLSKGVAFGSYVQGKTLTNEPVIQLMDNSKGTERTPMYATMSSSVDVTTKGVSQLQNGSFYVVFGEKFQDMLSENQPIIVTVTPTEESKGVFVRNVTTRGFEVVENGNGTANASFNWIAVGTNKNFENVVIAKEVLSKDFDDNMRRVMLDDGHVKGQEEATEAKSLYFDGSQMVFDRIPEKYIKSAEKKIPTRSDK